MPHSHNRVVRGATGKRCAISLIRRGFRACEEGRAELRGGGAAMQDGTNAGAVHDAAGGDLRNVELPHEKPGEHDRPETTIRHIWIEHAPWPPAS